MRKANFLGAQPGWPLTPCEIVILSDLLALSRHWRDGNDPYVTCSPPVEFPPAEVRRWRQELNGEFYRYSLKAEKHKDEMLAIGELPKATVSEPTTSLKDLKEILIG